MFDLVKYLVENKLTPNSRALQEFDNDKLNKLKERFGLCFQASKGYSISELRKDPKSQPSEPGWYIWYTQDDTPVGNLLISDLFSDEGLDRFNVSGRVCYVGQARDLRGRYRKSAGYLQIRPDISSAGATPKGSRYPIHSDKLKNIIPLLVNYYPEYLTFLKDESFLDWLESQPEEVKIQYKLGDDVTDSMRGGNASHMTHLLNFLQDRGGIDRATALTNPKAKEAYTQVKESILTWMNDYIYVKFITLSDSTIANKYFSGPEGTRNREVVEGYIAEMELGDLISSRNQTSWCINLDDMRSKGSLQLNLES